MDSELTRRTGRGREIDRQHLSVGTKRHTHYPRYFFPLGKLPCSLFGKFFFFFFFKNNASEAQRQSEFNVGFVKKDINPAPSKT